MFGLRCGLRAAVAVVALGCAEGVGMDGDTTIGGLPDGGAADGSTGGAPGDGAPGGGVFVATDGGTTLAPGDAPLFDDCRTPADCLPDSTCIGVARESGYYFFCSATLSWDEARQSCMSVPGTDLVSIESDDENQFVTSMLMADVWFGGERGSGTWTWVGSGEGFWNGGPDGSAAGGAYSQWVESHPNDAGDCVLYFSARMGWAVASCSSRFGYVCERPIDLCPDDPDKTEPGECGCGETEEDSDGDGTLDCRDECPRDPARDTPGTCGCVGLPDPAPAGTPCDDGLCSANTECDGMGSCGDPADCCVAGADSDGDGITDCDEVGDGSTWTDPDVFNGVHGRVKSHCDSNGSCGNYDTLAEVNNCMSGNIQSEVDQSAGWDWQNPNDDVCHGGYGFQPNFDWCDNEWQADWQGFIQLNKGRHCFSIEGSTDQSCASLFFSTEPAGSFGGWEGAADRPADTQTGGPVACFDLEAGVYPIRWHYSMDNAGSRALSLRYCAGGQMDCTPAGALPAGLLRPTP